MIFRMDIDLDELPELKNPQQLAAYLVPMIHKTLFAAMVADITNPVEADGPFISEGCRSINKDKVHTRLQVLDEPMNTQRTLFNALSTILPDGEVIHTHEKH